MLYNLPGTQNRKWSQQRAGPFRIVAKKGDLAYELDFPPSWKVHRTVSVAQLVPAPEGTDPFERQPEHDVRRVVDDDSGRVFEIEKLLERRPVWRGHDPKIEYLVKFKSWGSHFNSFQPRVSLLQTAGHLVRAYEQDNPIQAKGKQKVVDSPEDKESRSKKAKNAKPVTLENTEPAGPPDELGFDEDEYARQCDEKAEEIEELLRLQTAATGSVQLLPSASAIGL